MQVTLEVIGKKSNVKRVMLNESTLIGRGAECNLKIVSSQISRKHCRIDVESNRVTICDLGSANGTFINDSQILPDERVEISSGTTLRLGNVHFRLQFQQDKSNPAFEEEGSTLELAAYRDAENLKQVEERIASEKERKSSGTVDKEDVIPDVIIEEDDEEDAIELEAIKPKSATKKTGKVNDSEAKNPEETKEDEASEDDIAGFLFDIDIPEESTDNNPTDLKDFLDQFE
ncbi:hypothetical protein MNBD_PLANCTO02-2065 [hydrothermal vent metagenome]|uniref:FHA domain-containing protein n=1 Tax=hydrothermal vent metagenome TaxID=652676 RepID=A0A3B1DPP0_9ZZZZ